jgi:hypothetical protein
MIDHFLRMNNLDGPDLFAKHQTVFHTPQPEIINVGSEFVDVGRQDFLSILILIKPAL